MIYDRIVFKHIGVTAEISFFSVSDVGEWHVMLHIDPQGEMFENQCKRIYEAESLLLSLPQFHGAQYVVKRYFLSDIANQQPSMRQEEGICVSQIQQSPLDGSKLAVWLYLIRGSKISSCGVNAVSVTHNGYRHLWHMGLVCEQGDSAWQTRMLLEAYERELACFNATLAENCIRTWFYVRDVDTNYHGLVVARRENFIAQGLTSQTHYISSTGIGGSSACVKALIQLGCYAVVGLQPGQQRYLYAPTHLNPTDEYGVTFERGTVVEYADRAHIFISGTASIDNQGQVLHVGDIRHQTLRMWENVGMLLAEADASFSDVMQIIVYLRDVADYTLVCNMFQERFPQIPTVIVLAAVCRPTWLIEMECIAVKERNNLQFEAF